MIGNANPWVKELLYWHGHDRGGVRVPFQDDAGRPLQQVIETRVIRKLRHLAQRIAQGEDTPRWLVLVGGPGNGKSEAVQDFVMTLDRELGCEGLLVSTVAQGFTAGPVIARRVDIGAHEAGALPANFAKRVGRLIIVQDASAAEGAYDDAARILAEDMLDLTTHPAPVPVFVCCANRGLLARCLKVASQEDTLAEVASIASKVISATALGQGALSRPRPACWPLGIDPRVACWPLDMESLLLEEAAGGLSISPVEQAILCAVDAQKWEQAGRCQDCAHHELCPFAWNANWLRDCQRRQALLSVMRRGELATGQRWTFRDVFSLVAEVVVGQWADFETADHPCEWVHVMAGLLSSDEAGAPERARAAYLLSRRLYPNAMFAGQPAGRLDPTCKETAEQRGLSLTLAIDDAISAGRPGFSTHIRELLGILAQWVDPALASPRERTHPLARIEDAYSQSVALGNTSWPAGELMSEIEQRFLSSAEEAENEWDLLGRESGQVMRALRILRCACSVLAKRSVGLRMGLHANEDHLEEYRVSIRDQRRLLSVRDILRQLLGDGGFCFNMLQSFGQPEAESERMVTLRASAVPIRPVVPAPGATEELPAHDLPCLEIGENRVPLTFDLFRALRLRQSGCVGSSLPATVRTAIDRVRHLRAGALCRDKLQFVEQGAQFELRGHGKVVLMTESDAPEFIAET